MLLAVVALCLQLASAQKKEVVWTADEKPIADAIHGLRGLRDDVRAVTTRELALKTRKLPASANKLRLAVSLAELSTEGDFGHDTLQQVATTLAETLSERPVPWAKAKHAGASGDASAKRAPADPYVELATLVRYEHVEAPDDLNGNEQFRAAMAQLEADVAATAKRALAASLDDLGSATFRADIASMRHETQYTRLFRS